MSDSISDDIDNCPSVVMVNLPKDDNRTLPNNHSCVGVGLPLILVYAVIVTLSPTAARNTGSLTVTPFGGTT